MPWPEPIQNETESEFISRCMADEYIRQDIPTQDQRLAVCYQQWESGKQEDIMKIERKYFTGVELKSEKPGNFTARIATLNVIDKDGDVTLPGAFPVGKAILISAYMHGSWMGALPVGKGIIREDGDDVLVEGEFNLNTAGGKEHYETLKFAPDLSEWSYGFIVKANDDESDWLDKPGVLRVLKSLDVFEASPVLRGAGVDTALLAIKSETKGAISFQSAHPDGTSKADEGEDWDAGKEIAAASVDDLKIMCTWVDSENRDNKTAYKLPHHKAAGQHSVVWKGVAGAMAALLGSRGGVDIPTGDRKGVYNHLKKHYAEFEKEPPDFHAFNEGLTFASQTETALAAVNDLVTRARSLADLRRKEGRTLSAANRERIANLLKSISEVAADLKELLDSTEPDNEKARQIYLRYIKIQNEMRGIIQ